MGSNPTPSAIEAIEETLAACLAAGRFAAMAERYAPDAVLEAHLPGREVRVAGPDAIVAELDTWFPGPGTVTWHDGLLGPEAERAGPGERRLRQAHWLHEADGRVTRHVVWPNRPQDDVALGPPVPDLLAGAVKRTPLGHAGQAGSRLERAVVPDGTRLVVKRISAELDWIMRATRDTGREATLWAWGALQGLPPGVRDPVVAVARDGDGWAIAMEDVTDWLVPAVPFGLPAESSRRILGAAASVHEAFAGRQPPGLCSLADRYTLLSPSTGRRERDGVDYIPKQVARGWELFADLAPADVARAIEAVHADPGRLAAELERGELTVVHGDVNLRNVALTPDAVILLDWALAAAGPAEVDYAFYLTSWFLTQTSREQVVADCRAAAGDRWDDRSWELALLGQLAWDGQFLAVLAVDHPVDAVRQFAAAELDWWVERVRTALETWSPV